MLAVCSSGPLPVSTTCVIASNSSRRPRGMKLMQLASSRPRYCSSSPGVEAEEAGHALGAVVARDLLRLVDHVRERQAVLLSEGLHVVERVLRVGIGIV